MKTVRWLFSMYEHVQRRKYNEMTFQISAVELGIQRAFSAPKDRASLPTYDEMLQKEMAKHVEPQKPAWMAKYEEVNKDKMLRNKVQAEE